MFFTHVLLNRFVIIPYCCNGAFFLLEIGPLIMIIVEALIFYDIHPHGYVLMSQCV